MAVEGTVDVPGMGKVDKKVAIGGLVVVGGLIVIYYVRKNSSRGQAAATPSNQYPPDGTTGNPADPYSTDPATGQTYGDEAVGAGSYGAYQNQYGPAGVVGYDSAGNPVYAPGYQPSGTAGAAGGPPFSSNSQWTSWVIQQMTADDPALDAGALTDALGLYINGQPVDQAQKTLIFDAIAIAGDPPVAGPAGYPPKVQTNGSKGPPPPPPPPAYVPGAVTGLKATQIGSSSVTLIWNPTPHATGYAIRQESPVAGPLSHTSSPAFRATGLKARTRYTFYVTAEPAKTGHAVVSFTTG